MAYFERADERDRRIVCNICNVECAERTIVIHRSKCSEKPDHATKFRKGQLVRCNLDSSHIINGGDMDLHLEFCAKNQCRILAEYQRAMRDQHNSSPSKPSPGEDVGWNKVVALSEQEDFTNKMANLNI